MLLSRWLNAFTSRLSLSGKKSRLGSRRSAGRGISAARRSASWIVSPDGSGQASGIGSVVEQLEDRALLSITTGFAGGVLTFTGDGANDKLVLRSTGSTSTVEYDDGNSLGFTTQAGVTQVIFNAGGGDDQLIVFNANGNIFAPASGITFTAGAHTTGDTLTIGGGGPGITAAYTPSGTNSGTIGYTLGGNTESIAFTGVETLNDEKTADSLTVNGTGASDAIAIGSGPTTPVVVIDHGGPVVIDGGDRDQHGSFSGGNQAGWKFIEQSLNFLNTQQDNPNTVAGKHILVIGATNTAFTDDAYDAVQSAAGALGLNFDVITGAAISTVNFQDYRILYVPTNTPETDGGITQADKDLLATRTTAIKDFVRVGGGVFGLTEDDLTSPFSWLAIPSAFTTAVPTAGGDVTMVQTPALAAAGFNISDSELTNGTPIHNVFTGPAGFNGLSVFVNNTFGEVVTLGRGATSQTVGGTATETVTVGAFLPINFDSKTALVVNWQGGNDTHSTQAMTTGTPQDLRGGAGVNDVLTIDAQGQTVTDTGTEFQFTGGYQPIKYSGWETINIVNAAVAPLLIDGTAGNDNITLSFTASTVGVSYGGVTYNYERPTTTGVTVNGGDGSDTLTVDLTGNDVLPAGFVTFNGGESVGDHDVAIVTGYNLSTDVAGRANGIADVTVNHTGTEDGNVVFAGLGTFFFTQTEPLVLTGTAADMVINLPAGANPDVLFADDTNGNFPGNGTSVAGRSAIDASTFEYTEFVNPTNTLHINLGAAGDTITIGALDAAYAPGAGTTILGGTGGDTFNVISATPAATNIDLLGGDGGDTFTINAVLTGEVNGQVGTDILQGTLIDQATLNGGNANGFDGVEASVTAGFNGIERINADAATANTTLTGRFDISTWTLNIGGTVGRYDDSDATTPQLIYQDFDTLQGGGQSDLFSVSQPSTFNLNGGDGADTFDIDAALTGTIAGGLGADLLQGDLITAVTLTGSNAANGYAGNEPDINGNVTSFTGINTLTASPVADSFLSGENTVSTWTLDGTPTYNDGAGNGVLDFSGFETLNGGSANDSFFVTVDPNDGVGAVGTTLFGNAGADLFDIDVAFLGQIQGGGVGPATDLDTLMGDMIDAVVLVSSDNEGFNGTENSITPNAGLGFLGIDRITATTLVTSRLTGRDIGSTWTISAGASSYTDGTRVLPIDTEFDSLQGGANNDIFNITASSDFDLFGGAGSDTFNVIGAAVVLTGTIAGEGANDLLQGTGIDNVTLTGSTGATEFSGQEANITGGFTGIGNIIGNGGTLTGENALTAATSTWTLNGFPTYNDGTNNLQFSGFATLQGADGVDNFTVSLDDSPFTLNGGIGNDTFTLNQTLAAGNSVNGQAGNDTLIGSTIVTVTLTGASGSGIGLSGTVGSIPGGFTGIDTLTGAGGGTLTGAGTPSTWALNGGTEQYTTVGETLNIIGFPTLQGGAGVDTFNVTGAVGTPTAQFRGGAGNDIFNLSAVLTGDIFGEAGATDTVNFLNGGSVTGNIDLGTSGILDFSGQNVNAALMRLTAGGTSDGFQVVDFGPSFLGQTALFTGTANNITSIIGAPVGAGLLGFDALFGTADPTSNWTLNGTTHTCSSRALTHPPSRMRSHAVCR